MTLKLWLRWSCIYWLIGWGGRLEQQEAEEEQKYLMEQQRQTQVNKYSVFKEHCHSRRNFNWLSISYSQRYSNSLSDQDCIEYHFLFENW